MNQHLAEISKCVSVSAIALLTRLHQLTGLATPSC
jgi:hypothetical protein